MQLDGTGADGSRTYRRGCWPTGLMIGRAAGPVFLVWGGKEYQGDGERGHEPVDVS
jgi:hypothetical protein